MLDVLKRKEKAFVLASCTGMGCSLAFVLINLLRERPSLALGNIALFTALTLNLVLYFRHRSLPIAVTTGIAFILSFILYAADKIGAQAFFWVYTLPWVAFFFLGLRNGLRINLIITLILFAWLQYRPAQISVQYSLEVELVLSVLVVSTLSYIYEYIRDAHQRELERLVATDPLTQTVNRIGFQQYLEVAIAAARRHDHPLALITFDIDHFKQLNDTFGHPAGDAVLQELARLARETIRRSDVLARWGGEEFQVLAVQTTLEGAMILAEKLRSAIEGRTFTPAARVTISAGVAALRDGDSLETLLKRADVALYRAKNGGRNKVEVEL